MKNENSKHFGWTPIGDVARGMTRSTSDAHEARRDKLASDIDAFLADGGKIKQVKAGESGFKVTKQLKFAKEKKPHG